MSSSRNYGPLSIILDLDIESKEMKEKLEYYGHRAERAVNVATLGHNSSDAQLANYSNKQGKFIATFDSDFTPNGSGPDPSNTQGVFYVEDQSLTPGQVSKAITLISLRISHRYIKGNCIDSIRSYYDQTKQYPTVF